MSRSRTPFALAAVVLLAVSAFAVAACTGTVAPRPARETGGPAPTACTSAEVQFLHNQ